MPKILVKFLLIIPLFLFAGCFEIIEEVTLNKDGSGKVSLTINLSKSKAKLNSIMLLDSVNDYKVPAKSEIEKHFTDVANTIKNIKGISNVKNTINFKEYIFNISCDFASVEALNAVISNFSTKEDAKKISINKHFIYDKTKNLFTRSYHYDLAKEFNKTNMADRKIFKTATYTTIYRFEKSIISANNKAAKIAGNKKAIMLRLNAQDIISNKNTIKNKIQLQK